MNTNKSIELVAKTDRAVHNDVTCYGCQFLGHYHNQYPYQERNGTMSVHIGCLLSQGCYFQIPKSWLLLDTCSTCDVANNPDLFTDIKECASEDILIAYTNAGEQKYDKFAHLSLLPIKVHFKHDLMANILSL